MSTVQVKKICKIFCLHWLPFCNNIHSLPQIWPDCGSVNHAPKFNKLSCKSMVLKNKCNYPRSSAIFLTVWFHLTWCALKRKDARWLWKGCSPASLKSPVTEIHLAYTKSRSWPTSCPVISSSLKRHSWGLEWICDAVPNQKHCSILKHLKFLIECFTALWNYTCWKHGFRKRKEKSINICNTCLSSFGKFTFSQRKSSMQSIPRCAWVMGDFPANFRCWKKTKDGK